MSGFEDNLFDFCDDETPSSGNVSKPLSRSADRGSKRSLDQDAPEKEIPNVTIKGVLQQISEKSDGPVLPSPPKRTKLSDDLKIDTRLYKSRISVVRVDCPTGCSHEVVCPPDAEYKPLEPIATPAREYKFKLDPFQQRAVQCIDNLQSVLVSAHTSAGKTVVAEYAIALGLKKNQRVIYTTPIKALSNQKYREFSDDFADVGLMTGDVTINPNASCLIMTTEILRSMLYRGSEILREVGWVVFDEIHYMRNKERGYVWEETIILLQDEIRMVFLSATVPNARQFAEWVVNLHMQPVHVVYTEYRPVPLQHYVYPTGGNGIHLVVDETGTFREGNFNRAMATLQTQGDDDADSSGKRFRRARSDVQSIMRLIRMVMEHDLAPVIIFSFAKRECEQYASECNGLDFNTPKEKELVTEVFNNAIDVLSEEDKNLPQVKNIMPMLVRGIGIHHGGLLPILKETIEILFGEGLIKALFATETFAMGLNMPARTVVFTSARKFDGKEQRWLHGAEYIQMSGRAGRRGKDDKGVVIFMVDEKMSPSIGRNLLQGNPEQLTSAFQLTYNMVLNLLRVDGINPEFMLQRSFHQFQSYANVPVLLKEIEDSQTEYDGINLDNEDEFATYHKIRKVLDDLRTQYQGHITVPKYMGPFLQVGRLIHVKVDGQDYGWAAVVSYRKIERKNHNRKREQALVEEDEYELHVLMRRAKDAHPVAPAAPGVPSSNDIVEISLVHIVEVSAVRMKLPRELTTVDSKAEVMKKIDEAKRRFSGSPPLIDPWKDMKIEEEGFKTVVTKMKLFKDRLENHPLNGTPDVEEKYALFLRKVKARERALKAKDELKSAQELLQMEELKKKTKILKALNYCSASGVLDLKGRVACELSSADELMLAEMLFEGIFQKLPPSECMAVLSCLVCDENSKARDAGRVSNSLSGPLKQMQEIARRLAKVFRDHGLTVEPEEYVGRFKPHLMDVVFEWCKGATFGRLLKMTDIFEGSIIRCMRRLEETTRQCIQAARGIGNKELEEKFHEGIKLIKRDIVFAASLYL